MRALPFDYAIRNLGRRPMRTLLTGLSSALVAALLVATTAFVRGLGGTFSGAAQSDTAILLSTVAERDVVRSTVTAGLPELVSASVAGVKQIGGIPAISAEIHMGTNLRLVGPMLPDSRQLRLQRMYPGSKWFGQQRAATVPLPAGASDDDLIVWVGRVLTALYAPEPAPASADASASPSA